MVTYNETLRLTERTEKDIEQAAAREERAIERDAEFKKYLEIHNELRKKLAKRTDYRWQQQYARCQERFVRHLQDWQLLCCRIYVTYAQDDGGRECPEPVEHIYVGETGEDTWLTEKILRFTEEEAREFLSLSSDYYIVLGGTTIQDEPQVVYFDIAMRPCNKPQAAV